VSIHIYRDNIKSGPGFKGESAFEVEKGSLGNLNLLLVVHGFFRPAEPPGTLAFYLDKSNGRPVLGYNIDFSQGAPEVSLENLIFIINQVICGKVLSFSS